MTILNLNIMAVRGGPHVFLAFQVLIDAKKLLKIFSAHVYYCKH